MNPAQESGRAGAKRFLRPFKRSAVATLLGIERNVVAASGAVFCVGLGEELWKKYLPKYLEALGASVVVVGAFGTAEDFFDAVYQYPGGWLADHWGLRRAFMALLFAALTGYLVYLLSPSWPLLFLGLALVMAWQSMGSPALFATIGAALPAERRTMGFTVQSILKRFPMVISPLLGAALIHALGLQAGIHIGFLVTIATACVAILLLWGICLPAAPCDSVNLRGVWSSLHPALKRLLASDIAIRTCEGMADIFVILYVTDLTHISVPQYGVLVTIQLATSILIYIPAAALSHAVGRRPLVIATFLCFACYPVTVVLARNFAGLLLAFVVGGLREVGEPCRKAMIVNLAHPHRRARTVGLYYFTRSLSITPASVIGGLLWKVGPQIPFLTAGVIGFFGTLLFAATLKQEGTQ